MGWPKLQGCWAALRANWRDVAQAVQMVGIVVALAALAPQYRDYRDQLASSSEEREQRILDPQALQLERLRAAVTTDAGAARSISTLQEVARHNGGRIGALDLINVHAPNVVVVGGMPPNPGEPVVTGCNRPGASVARTLVTVDEMRGTKLSSLMYPSNFFRARWFDLTLTDVDLTYANLKEACLIDVRIAGIAGSLANFEAAHLVGVVFDDQTRP
jgi:hypothetical protein